MQILAVSFLLYKAIPNAFGNELRPIYRAIRRNNNEVEMEITSKLVYFNLSSFLTLVNRLLNSL